MMQVPVMFNEQQVMALRQLIDIAVKAGGMRVAEVAVVLDNMLEQAAEAAQEAAKKPPQEQRRGNGSGAEIIDLKEPSEKPAAIEKVNA